MVMRETKNIEFKESITNTFLKTVSAFANYEGGDIYFGIEDSGKIIGLEDVKSSCLDIEIFGTGILRIKHLYANSFNQPKFEVFDNSITIVLPVWEEHLHLTADERKVYSVLSRTVLKSISEIAPHLDFGKTKTTQLLNSMVKRGIVKTEGQGRGTKSLLKGIKRQGSA